ncbi:MAG: hypothetical protein AB1810_11420 [Pseudomonadota bacterium]
MIRILSVWVLSMQIFAAQAADDFDIPDPTRSSSSRGYVAKQPGQAAAPGELVLQSTLVGAGRSLATINGKTLAIGDVIDNAKVVTIGANEVILERNGRELRLQLVSHVSIDRGLDGER